MRPKEGDDVQSNMKWSNNRRSTTTASIFLCSRHPLLSTLHNCQLLSGERYVYKFVCDPDALFQMALAENHRNALRAEAASVISRAANSGQSSTAAAAAASEEERVIARQQQHYQLMQQHHHEQQQQQQEQQNAHPHHHQYSDMLNQVYANHLNAQLQVRRL